MNEKELQAMIESQLAQGIQRRQEDADLLRMLAQKQVEQPAQTDLSGFFDMAEIAGASPRAGARYAAPKSQSPLAAIQPVMKAEGDIAADQINYLKTKLGGLQDQSSLMLQAAKFAQYKDHFNRAKELDVVTRVANSDDVKKAKANALLIDKVNQYENVFKEIGEKGTLTGVEKAKLDSAAKEAEIAWKEAAYLGALQGGDLEMIKGALGEAPTTPKMFGLGGYAISGGAEGLKAKLKTARTAAKRSSDYVLKNIETVYPKEKYPVTEPIYQNLRSQLNELAKGKTIGQVDSTDTDIADQLRMIKELEAKAEE